jgi:hypothetical protein
MKAIIIRGEINMAINREELHRIIDSIPSHKLPNIADLLRRIYDEDDEPLTAKEELEIQEAEKRIDSGEYTTLEDLLRKYSEER